MMKMPRPSAADIAHVLKKMGKGNMGRGVGVFAIIGAIVGGIIVAIASRLTPDPELMDLEEKLKRANELYRAAQNVTRQQEMEINELNKKIEELHQSGERDHAQIESLKSRLLDLIEQLQGHPNHE